MPTAQRSFSTLFLANSSSGVVAVKAGELGEALSVMGAARDWTGRFLRDALYMT